MVEKKQNSLDEILTFFLGLWLDMNEIVGFCDGECSEKKKLDSIGNSIIDENHPPYM